MQSILQDAKLGPLMGNAYGKEIFQMLTKLLFCTTYEEADASPLSHRQRKGISGKSPWAARQEMMVTVPKPWPQPSFVLGGCMCLLTGRSGCVQITPLNFAFHSPPSISAQKLRDGSSYLLSSPAGKHKEGFKQVKNWSSVFLHYL